MDGDCSIRSWIFVIPSLKGTDPKFYSQVLENWKVVWILHNPWFYVELLSLIILYSYLLNAKLRDKFWKKIERLIMS